LARTTLETGESRFRNRVWGEQKLGKRDAAELGPERGGSRGPFTEAPG